MSIKRTQAEILKRMRRGREPCRGRKHKYGANPVRIDGIWFASTAEGEYYRKLKLLEGKNIIRDLRLQVRYPLHSATGQVIAHYVADFVYVRAEDDAEVVVDVKGHRTREYKQKRRWFEDEYAPLTITEVKG